MHPPHRSQHGSDHDSQCAVILAASDVISGGGQVGYEIGAFSWRLGSSFLLWFLLAAKLPAVFCIERALSGQQLPQAPCTRNFPVLTPMALDLQASGQALKQAFADPTRSWWTLLALAAVPVLFVTSRALKRAAKGALHRLKTWSGQPPAWAVELQYLREGLERLQRQQQENAEKLQANFEKSLAALKTDQQVHLVENLDTLHTAVKQGAQKVTLDGAQLQQIKVLLTQESAETRKAVVLHKDLLDEVSKQQKVLETMQDGSLVQVREVLQDQQAGNKQVCEKINELSDKLIVLDRLVDALSGSLQKISNEIHVGFTRGDQKAEKHHSQWHSENGSIKSYVTSIIPMIRETKANVDKLGQSATEQATESDGIRRRIDDLPIDDIMRHLGCTEHISGEVKDTLDQVWSWLTDICRNVQDVTQRVQELDEKVMERLPKLPARKPPTQTGASSTGTNTDPPREPETLRLQEAVPASSHPLFVSPTPLIMAPPTGQGAPLLLTPQQQDALQRAYVFQR